MSVVTDSENEDLKTHVAVCDARYRGINARLARIERILFWGLAAVVATQGGLIEFLLKLVTKS